MRSSPARGRASRLTSRLPGGACGDLFASSQVRNIHRGGVTPPNHWTRGELASFCGSLQYPTEGAGRPMDRHAYPLLAATYRPGESRMQHQSKHCPMTPIAESTMLAHSRRLPRGVMGGSFGPRHGKGRLSLRCGSHPTMWVKLPPLAQPLSAVPARTLPILRRAPRAAVSIVARANAAHHSRPWRGGEARLGCSALRCGE